MPGVFSFHHKSLSNQAKESATRPHASHVKGGIRATLGRILFKRRTLHPKRADRGAGPNKNDKKLHTSSLPASKSYFGKRKFRFWTNRLIPKREATNDTKIVVIQRLATIPTLLNGNHKLDMDILITIFSYYATQETVEHPIETLLLVCKTWNMAALSHCALWGHFRIQIAHVASISKLTRRVKLRLERSGDVVPLHVELRDLLYHDYEVFVEGIDYCEPEAPVRARCEAEAAREPSDRTPCRCQQEEDHCIRSLLKILTGPDGLHCARWKTLILDFDRGRIAHHEDRGVASCLQYPTPSLVSLTLQYILADASDEGLPFLPYAPRLRELALDHSLVPSIPNKDKLEYAGISWKSNPGEADVGELDYISSSTELKVLKLHLSVDVELPLPAELPWLWRLDLRGLILPHDMQMTAVPRLTYLTIGVRGYALLRDLNWCRRIPFSTLTHLQLWYEDIPVEDIDIVVYHLQELLRILSGLEVLIADVRMMSVMLRIIWRDSPHFIDHLQPGEGSSSRSQPVFAERALLLRLLNEPTQETLCLRSDRRQVVGVARSLGVICPEENWEFIVERLRRPWAHP